MFVWRSKLISLRREKEKEKRRRISIKFNLELFIFNRWWLRNPIMMKLPVFLYLFWMWLTEIVWKRKHFCELIIIDQCFFFSFLQIRFNDVLLPLGESSTGLHSDKDTFAFKLIRTTFKKKKTTIFFFKFLIQMCFILLHIICTVFSSFHIFFHIFFSSSFH